MLVPQAQLLIDCRLSKEARLGQSGLLLPFLKDIHQYQHRKRQACALEIV
jgi:hypothetical protein